MASMKIIPPQFLQERLRRKFWRALLATPRESQALPLQLFVEHTFFGQLRCNPRTLRFKASPVPTGLF